MHTHSTLEKIEKIVSNLKLPELVKHDVLEIYKIIADAESRAHGRPVEEIHFHEVGTKDAIMDIAAACLIIRHLNPDQILASPICTGKGTVSTEHGILPVPAPAVSFILEGIPTYQGEVNSELTTPTGAAILKYFVEEYTSQPLMRVERIGTGFGKKTFPELNAVRAFYGETEPEKEKIVKVECNIDDMTGEEIGYAVEELLKTPVREVYTTPINMKKNRPGILITVLVEKEYLEETIERIFKLTTTIGLRVIPLERYTLDRHEEDKGIREKISSGYGVVKRKYEYEDLAEYAREHDLSLMQAREKINES